MTIFIKALSEIDPVLLAKKEFLEGLFEQKIENIFVFLLFREDFSKLRQKDWVVGFAYPLKNFIFVLEQEESGRSREEWLKAIIHEMVHLFYVAKFKTHEPAWFFEGLACYLAEQKKPIKDISVKELLNNFSIFNKEVYTLGYAAIEKILGDKE